jgi:hypothetical protein
MIKNKRNAVEFEPLEGKVNKPTKLINETVENRQCQQS